MRKHTGICGFCFSSLIILILFIWSNDAQATPPLNAGQSSKSPWEFTCENDDPLGMISGAIADWQITASSTYPASWIKGCAERNARLFRPNGVAWCAKFKSSSEWLQIDLGVKALITGIMTQGRGDGSEWVTSFMISYSDDAMQWKFVADQYGSQKIFEGNSDSFSVKHNYLDEAIAARYVKIHTYTWNNHPSLRVELVGCQPCKQLIGIPPYARYAASSSKGKRAHRSCTPEYGHYLSNKAWCSKRQDILQWLQIDVGPPTLITGVILKGRGDIKRPQYVTRFKMSYSNDTRLWYFYKDATPLDPRSAVWSFDWNSRAGNLERPEQADMVFDGNNEESSERVHYLTSPFIARFVRIHPVHWRGRVAMRVGLIGCRHKGSCGAGYFRINNESSCVANLAYKKSAWMAPSAAKHQKRHLPGTAGVANYAVDSSYAGPNGASPTNGGYAHRLENDGERPPMLARHRIGEVGGPTGGNSYWPQADPMLNDPSFRESNDEMAIRAVDGLTGEESEQDLARTRRDRPMNDDPSPANPEGSKTAKQKLVLGKVEEIKGKRHVCTVLEYKWPFVELPSWYVDLREESEVNGVVIYTAQHGRDTKQLIARSMEKTAGSSEVNSENLERLSVYVEDEPRHRGSTLASSSTPRLCGFVTRLNDAIFQPRLHIACRQPLRGRYVYVEASGMRGRWSQEFAALLCEVMVY